MDLPERGREKERDEKDDEGEKEKEKAGGGRVVRAKRMTVIRPIIGWHQKCWVWLACQMGNSRRTAEASYSCSYGPTDSARGLYGSPSPISFPPADLSRHDMDSHDRASCRTM